MPLGVSIALVWANLAAESLLHVQLRSPFAVNDVAMVFFFGLMTKEVVEATAPGGVIHPWRRVLLPVVASFGVALVPALIHLSLVEPLDEPMLAVGVAGDAGDGHRRELPRRAVDIRPASRRHPFRDPARDRDERLGFVALALFSPSREPHWAAGLSSSWPPMGFAVALRELRVTSFWPYLLGPGASRGLRSTGSGFIPRWRWSPSCRFCRMRRAIPGSSWTRRPKPGTRSVGSKCSGGTRRRSALFFFGLVNAGVPFGALEQGTWALPIAVLVGKPVGMLLGAGRCDDGGPSPAATSELA